MKKQKDISIETSEKIIFSYKIADIGTRIAAYLLDSLIQVIFLGLVYLILVISSLESENLSYITGTFYLLIIFIIQWFYFVIFEVIMEGQTPGKKAMRIRVLKTDGNSLDFQTIVIRNFLRAVDGFPIFSFTGGFIVLIDKKNRRLGDLIGNTIVVYEIDFKLSLPDFNVNINTDTIETQKNYTKTKLTEKELFIIRKFLNARNKLPQEKQNEVAKKLVNQIKIRLKIVEDIANNVEFLERIYKQYGK